MDDIYGYCHNSNLDDEIDNDLTYENQNSSFLIGW